MRKKRLSTEVRQAQIIKAAWVLIPRIGSENVTVRKLANSIGVTEPAVYRHFKNKKEIMFALLESIEKELLGDLTLMNDEKRTDIETLEKSLKTHLLSIKQRQGISFQVLSEIVSLGDKKLNTAGFRVVTNYSRSIGNTLSEITRGCQNGTDAGLQHLGVLVYCLLQGLTNYWALSNYSFNVENEFEKIWSLLKPVFNKY